MDAGLSLKRVLAGLDLLVCTGSSVISSSSSSSCSSGRSTGSSRSHSRSILRSAVAESLIVLPGASAASCCLVACRLYGGMEESSLRQLFGMGVRLLDDR